MKEHGVTAVVSMTQPWEMFVSAADLKLLGLDVLALPTVDYGAPTVEQITTAVDFLRAPERAVTYVHCNGGKGVLIHYLCEPSVESPRNVSSAF